MTLTTNDLQAISQILDEKLEEKLEKKLEEKFNQKLKPIKREIKKINDKIDTTIRFFDRSTIDHEKRLDHLEQHTTKLPKSIA